MVYDGEDPYPSLSGYHDYEPQLEFDDAELLERKPEPDGEDGECWLEQQRTRQKYFHLRSGGSRDRYQRKRPGIPIGVPNV